METTEQQHREFFDVCERIKNNDPTIRSIRLNKRDYDVFASFDEDMDTHLCINLDCSGEGAIEVVADALETNTVLEDVEIAISPWSHYEYDDEEFDDGDEDYENVDGDVECSDDIKSKRNPLLKLKDFLCNNDQLCVMRLELTFCSRWIDCAMKPIFQGLTISSLKELYLKIDSDGDSDFLLPILEFLDQNQTLEKLSIQNCSLLPRDLKVLASGLKRNHSIQHIELKRLSCDAQHSRAIQSFFDAIAMHPVISRFDMIRCYIPWSELERWYMVMAQNNCPLQILTIQCRDDYDDMINMSSDHIPHLKMSSDHMRHLAWFLTKPSSVCKSLSLRDIHLAGPVSSIFAGMLQINCRLETMSLIWNALKTEGATNIVRALTYNNTLKSFSLLANGILENDKYCEAWKEALVKNKNLRSLKLNTTWFSTWTTFFQALAKNTSLEHLTISGGDINAFCLYGSGPSAKEAVESLSNALNSTINDGGTSGLVELNLTKLGRLEDVDWVPFGEAVRYNDFLQKLKLRNVGLGNKSLGALAVSLTYNRALEILDISSNHDLTIDGFHRFCDNLGSMHGLKEFEFYNLRDSITYAELIASCLQENHTISRISPMGKLSRATRFYLRLNQNGRRFLHKDDDIPQALWAVILEQMTKQKEDIDILHFFFSQKLMSTNPFIYLTHEK